MIGKGGVQGGRGVERGACGDDWNDFRVGLRKSGEGGWCPDGADGRPFLPYALINMLKICRRPRGC